MMHILYVFTSGHFFSPNNKKWFKLFRNHQDVKISILIQEPQAEIKEKFHVQYGKYFNIHYFQSKEQLLKKSYIKRFTYIKHIARRIDQLAPDIVHIHGMYNIYLVLPLFFINTRPKIIMNVWGSDFNIMFNEKLKNRIVFKKILKKSRLIWANWLAMADNLRARFPKYNNKIRTLPLGVTDELFTESTEEDKNFIKKKFNIQKDEYLIVYTRGFKMNSNYHQILKALGRMNQDVPPYKVVFQHFKNNPFMDQYLQQLIDENNLQKNISISHADLSDGEMKALYELADLTFSVTGKEQFSRTIHESILSNTNLILNDIEPYRYLKYFFNWNVNLVDVNDEEQLGRKIEYYITYKPETNWEYERKFIEKIFKFENKEELFKSVYQDLIDENI